MYDENALKIYIDGSAIKNNPGAQVGCAGIVEFPEHYKKENEKLLWSYNVGTSGAMELYALSNALSWINLSIAKLKKIGINQIIIISDSSLVVNGSNSWVYSWQKNKFKKKNGEAVRNIEIWKKFLTERRKIKFNLEIRWQENKSDNITKEVDQLAKKQARKKIYNKINYDSTSRKVGRSLSGKKFKLENYPTDCHHILVRVYYHYLVDQRRNSDAKILFEEIKNNKVIGRYNALCSGEINTKYIDQHHFYYVSINRKSGHPRIIKIKELSTTEMQKLKNNFKT